MSEKKSGEISKQTRRRGDAETRRIQVPRKISFTPQWDYHRILNQELKLDIYPAQPSSYHEVQHGVQIVAAMARRRLLQSVQLFSTEALHDSDAQTHAWLDDHHSLMVEADCLLNGFVE
ncbi:MAG: hypothetical protein F6K58_06795 [Symploca sp. SIO2E9]|nr:hypothetical protein [Symploca sp. SIO2E9]